ncbi:MAG: hypothetical protein LQ346_001413 [Caloplaca aetnensis]|nr:MAG: hypothetical protein LQ346_001413 [Caloplaca aetnensis]
MSGVVIKIGSLLLKTLSKPVANYIKSQAREHARFRRICIAGAQRIHRLDMRLRLGLLQDHAAIDKQIAREAAEAQARRQKQELPTVKTEAQAKADEASLTADQKRGSEKAKAPVKPKIRPLSEAKAIDAGANFVSESFLLSVGIGLVVFERWWSSRRENSRREDVAERIGELEESEKSARRALVELEKEILRLRAKAGEGKSSKRILPKEVWEVEEQEEEQPPTKVAGLLSWFRRKPQAKKAETPQESTSRAAIMPENEHIAAEQRTSPPKIEVYLDTHDLALPVSTRGSDGRPRQQLFLLLTPVSILGNERHALLPRIERFATLTADPKPGIGFLLANNPLQNSTINGFHTYLTLQTILRLSIRLHELAIPLTLLPIASPPQLVPLLNSYAAAPPPVHHTVTAPLPIDLLRRVTATAPTRPLSEHSANVLSDICPSIRHVAATTESEEGMHALEDYLGEEDARNIECFWAGDWMCE